MRLKDLYKRNAVVVAGDSVAKTVHMPFASLGRLFSRHEAEALRRLEALGFEHAPKLLYHHGNQLMMSRIDGTRLERGRIADPRTLFGAIVVCVAELHALGFAHGNLSRDNVLVDEHGTVFLIDFETHCSASNPLFSSMTLWDYVRLYRLSQRIFGLDADEVRRIFSPHRAWLVTVARPVYEVSFALRRLKRRLRHRRGYR